MLKRLKTSLFAPQEIINMRVDRFGLVFLYVLLLSVVLMIPAAIKVARFQNVSLDYRFKIQDAFKGEDVAFAIIDNALINTSETKSKDIYIDEDIMVTFCLGEITNPEKSAKYRIVFCEKTVDLYYYLYGKKVSNVPLFRYSDYDELTNVNLRHSTSDTNYDFWNNIFNVVNKEIKLYIPYVVIGIVIGYTFTNLAIFLLVALLLALIQRIMTRQIISFKENYVIACYALSPMVIAGLLSQLFSIKFIYTIGIILAVVYNMIASNQLLSIRDRK